MSASMQAPPADSEAPNRKLVQVAAEARLPSRFGMFRVVAFDSVDGKEHAAIIKGDVRGAEDVPLRVHSECFTGDVMGSMKCDCRDQLEAALEYVGQQERGVVLYLRQEGRGIGLANKIRAYALQDAGLDTVEANHALGFQDDERRYDIAAEMIEELGIASIRLMTNNPNKIGQLQELGVEVSGRLPHQMEPNPYNEFYLNTKRDKSGHML